MYTNSTLKPIQDNDLYVGLDGTQWANTNKDTIPELHKVKETPKPNEDEFILDGFYINSKYEQVWNKTPKPAPKPEDVEGTPEYNLKHYADLRAREYPDYRDYLDGIVKGDAAQVQTYIDACLAVKAKYPKADEV
jgi:hypothetical protein